MAEPTRWTLRADKGGGPVHQDNGHIWGQAMCGTRRQFRHSDTQEAVDCPRCLKAIERGVPFSRGSR